MAFMYKKELGHGLEKEVSGLSTNKGKAFRNQQFFLTQGFGDP